MKTPTVVAGKQRYCLVCGAKVNNQNPKCVTCDPTCTAARKAGRTRSEQFKYELEHPDEFEVNEWHYCHRCGCYVSQCECDNDCSLPM